ncbi:hypothetical protein [Veronia nyctiphanis]|uniref:hypothetical protein n=1 Tax=Veronia nyctiphanis TaxID=1278244 RepID=UPI001375B20A|nr:hypothetical protein [Veronia nyctiphanis]
MGKMMGDNKQVEDDKMDKDKAHALNSNMRDFIQKEHEDTLEKLAATGQARKRYL